MIICINVFKLEIMIVVIDISLLRFEGCFKVKIDEKVEMRFVGK